MRSWSSQDCTLLLPRCKRQDDQRKTRNHHKSQRKRSHSDHHLPSSIPGPYPKWEIDDGGCDPLCFRWICLTLRAIFDVSLLKLEYSNLWILELCFETRTTVPWADMMWWCHLWYHIVHNYVLRGLTKFQTLTCVKIGWRVITLAKEEGVKPPDDLLTNYDRAFLALILFNFGCYYYCRLLVVEGRWWG